MRREVNGEGGRERERGEEREEWTVYYQVVVLGHDSLWTEEEYGSLEVRFMMCVCVSVVCVCVFFLCVCLLYVCMCARELMNGYCFNLLCDSSDRGRLTGLGENIDKIGKEKELQLESFTRYHLVKVAISSWFWCFFSNFSSRRRNRGGHWSMQSSFITDSLSMIMKSPMVKGSDMKLCSDSMIIPADLHSSPLSLFFYFTYSSLDNSLPPLPVGLPIASRVFSKHSTAWLWSWTVTMVKGEWLTRWEWSQVKEWANVENFRYFSPSLFLFFLFLPFLSLPSFHLWPLSLSFSLPSTSSQ